MSNGTTGESSSTGASSSSGAETSTGVVAPTSGGATSEVSGGESTSSGGDGSSEGGGAFVVDCFTKFVEQRLAFVCNLPPAVTDCAAVAAGLCEDADADGLTDLWEDLLLEVMRPVRRFDEAEQLLADPSAVMGDVGRVARIGERVHVYVMLGYHVDYGSCGFTAHNGDSERVVIETTAWPEGGPGGAIVTSVYTAAHEGTVTDHGKIFTGAALEQLVFTADAQTSDPRWVVFPSADKHATYATVEICENVSPIPCLDEDCAPDGVEDLSKFDALPPAVNAGEEAAPRVTELSAVGFPGEQAWAEQDFCGGLGGDGCSAPVREKLLVDPF